MSKSKKICVTILALEIVTLVAILGYLAEVINNPAAYVNMPAQDPTEMIVNEVRDISYEEPEPIEQIEETVEAVEEEPIFEEPEAWKTEIAIGGDEYGEDEPGYHPTSGLTKAGGVNYYGGRRETWYSSRVLYHYMTPQWTAGSDGVYRDSDGYVVVAASDIPYGSVIDTSFGPAKVYDCGCADGTTDVYVNW